MLLGSAAVLRKMSQGDWWPVLLLKKLTGGGLRERTGRTVSAHPIAWREAYTRGRGLGALLGKGLYLGGCLAAAVGLLVAYHLDRLPAVPGRTGTLATAEVFRTSLLVLLMLQVAVLTLVALYTASGSVSKEREDGTLDLILTTPVTPKQYVWGKLQGLVRFLAVLIAAPLLTLTLVAGYSLLGQVRGWPTATYAVPLANTASGWPRYTRSQGCRRATADPLRRRVRRGRDAPLAQEQDRRLRRRVHRQHHRPAHRRRRVRRLLLRHHRPAHRPARQRTEPRD
jgi:hypothetical protein